MGDETRERAQGTQATPDDQSRLRLGKVVIELRAAGDGARGRMLRYGALGVAALLFTLYTYAQAVGAGGGTYIVAFGAIVYGLGYAANAAFDLRKIKRALADIEGRYTVEQIDSAVSAWANVLLGETGKSQPTTSAPRPAKAPLPMGYEAPFLEED